MYDSVVVCSEFEIKEGKRPVLADMEQLQQRAKELGREAHSEVAAEHPGQPLPRETVTEDVLPTEVRAPAAARAWEAECQPENHAKAMSVQPPRFVKQDFSQRWCSRQVSMTLQAMGKAA